MKGQNTLIKARHAIPAKAKNVSLPALNCEIYSGQLVALIGLHPSRCLPYMNMLAAIEAPESGQLCILGHEDYEQLLSSESRLRRKLGFVLQGGPLLSVVNGIENLKLAARYHQIGDEAFIQQRVDALLSEIPEKASHTQLPAYMSRLLRRHLAIARPLMLDPQILFIDNPFEGLTCHDKSVLGRYLANIVRKTRVTLVISSDELIFTRLYADQIIYCDDEEILTFDDWKSFSTCPQTSIVSLFTLQYLDKYA